VTRTGPEGENLVNLNQFSSQNQQ